MVKQPTKLVQLLPFLLPTSYYFGPFRAIIVALSAYHYWELDRLRLGTKPTPERVAFSALIAAEVFLLGGNWVRALFGLGVIFLLAFLWSLIRKEGFAQRGQMLILAILSWGFVFKIATWPQTQGTHLFLLTAILLAVHVAGRTSLGPVLVVSLSILMSIYLLREVYPDYVNSKFYWGLNLAAGLTGGLASLLVSYVNVLSNPTGKKGSPFLESFAPLVVGAPFLFLAINLWVENHLLPL